MFNKHKRDREYGKDNDLIDHICEMRSQVGKSIDHSTNLTSVFRWGGAGRDYSSSRGQNKWAHAWSDILIVASEVLEEST